MKQLKKWAYLALAILLACSVLVLSGCKGGNSGDTETTGTQTTTGPATLAPEVTSGEPEGTSAPEETTEAVTDPDGGLWSPEMK